jgi:DnaJ-class molecular chaperone
MEQNHYYVLGINRHADINKIKRAYRDAARRYHPDHEGGDPEQFKRVQKAYETLSDADSRRDYDTRKGQGGIPIDVRTGYERRPREYGSSPSVRPGPGGISWDADRFFSFTDELLKGFVPGFFDRHIDREKDFYIDLVLSPWEAAEGGYVPIQMPVMIECPRCSAPGFFRRSDCPVCSGYGRVETARSFSLYVPPGIPSGIEETVCLDEIGLTGSKLHVNVIVRES